jgi:hypothetical protein
VQDVFFEDIVNALLLDALATAAGTVFPELDRRILADWVKSGCRCFRVNLILFRHECLRYGLLIPVFSRLPDFLKKSPRPL